MSQEKSGGIVLIIAVILALILANSPIREDYFNFFEQHFGFVYNGKPFFNFSLAHWINDGLMSLFFFVVGLELKREFIGGELRDIRKVTLPVGAAIFGMIVPALIYLAFNQGTSAANGWGIPMATDIAFALSILYLLGDKVPISAKVFLTTLAIVDDLGAVLVIALFYTSEISLVSVAVGIGFLLLMFIANKMGIKNVIFYGLVGIMGVWVAFLLSGIHATIAAVLSAFMIPADCTIDEGVFITKTKRLLHHFESAEPNDVITLEPEQVDILSKVKTTTEDAISPLQRLEHGMHPFVSFVVMPIFALSNAGVAFIDMDFGQLLSNNIAVGVMLGLLLGKPMGILFSVWLLVRLNIGQLSRSLTWKRLLGIGFLASIGFTMSMFITALVFVEPEYAVQAKVGIFAASSLGGLLGYLLLSNDSLKKDIN